MKKTLIALLALGGVAMANDDLCWTDNTSHNLGQMTLISSGTIGNTAGSIIAEASGRTSPAKFYMSLEFSVTQFADHTVHFLSFGANAGGSYNAYGFILSSEGALTFGRMGTDNLCDASQITTADNKVDIGILQTDKTYTLTLTSFADTTGTSYPGQGTKNFLITLNADEVEPVSVTAAGFGLNGNNFANLRMGSGYSVPEGQTGSALAGTISSISLLAAAPVPEPATATLSLLALAGLAARRRRH